MNKLKPTAPTIDIQHTTLLKLSLTFSIPPLVLGRNSVIFRSGLWNQELLIYIYIYIYSSNLTYSAIISQCGQ